MDTIDTPTTDIVIIDEAVLVEDCTNDSFGKEIAKTLTVSAATTAGMIGGMLVIGFAVGKFQQFKTKRAYKRIDELDTELAANAQENPHPEKD